VFVAELAALTLLRRAKPTYNAVSKFPSVRRDLALIVARDVPAGAIVEIVEETLGKVLIDLTLFDLYQGKGIDSTEKSVGVGLTLQHPSATLTEEEIGHYVDSVLGVLASRLGARLR
jgi:phenylalanyl-tRNA synthetase beta chain